MFQLNIPYTWVVSTKYTANNFSRRYFHMCFAGPSMDNSADADQMSPDVALHLDLHFNEVYLYPKLITHILHAWRYGKLTVYRTNCLF